jgi:hypothetical protein
MILKPPDIWAAQRFPKSVFLGGSIEMGKAEMWQNKVADRFDKLDWLVFNPRRDEWDPSWEQKVTNQQFSEQVNWELDALVTAEYILMYFQPGTMSPVSLLELGLFHNKCVVVCPEGFWRKGNVDITCEKFGIPQRDTLEHAIEYILEKAND